MRLVIVESPSKAKKIAEYLGDGYVVESSVGHIRDLPRNAADVPKAYKAEKWSRLGIDVDNGFKPLYVVSPDKKDQVKKLKALMKDADELYLATDKDREGEAIAWHLLEVLSPPTSMPVKRMVFTEVTKKAIKDAIDSPTELNLKLVDAQEARRMLDRLYGYEVSPVLWKKVMPQLSAGRVQSVATRIVVERERERMAFVSASYWDVTATFGIEREPEVGEPSTMNGKLIEVDGLKVATGASFNQDGTVKKPDETIIIDETKANTIVEGLEGVKVRVDSVESRPYSRKPAPPFITSTFQQEAGRKLNLSSAMAMRVAQNLYEGGFITYMRTDSTHLSDSALSAARSVVTERYGSEYLPAAPRNHSKNPAGAQEAHEAIRPAGEAFRSPEDVAPELNKTQLAVYELIWKRTVASQMTDVAGDTVTIRTKAATKDGTDTTFSSSGTVITHQGFRLVYVEDADAAGDDADELALPRVAEGDSMTTADVTAEGHDTKPPARFTEASLVKKLEELEVGRPSTYASIIETIKNRGYVWKKGSALIPTFTAFSVCNLLENHFPDLVDYGFTAGMERDLDSIATGSIEPVPWLQEFYFGADDDPGLKEKVDDRLAEIDARAVNSIPIGMDADGNAVVARVGRYGPYVERGEDRASIPDEIAPDELTIDRAVKFIEDAARGPVPLGEDPETGMNVYVMSGRFGDYVQLGEQPEDSDEKPKRASLLSAMSPETLTLSEALQLLSLPREVGEHPEGGLITVHNGRYGPYMSYQPPEGKADNRTLESEEKLFSLTLDEAVGLLKEPKRRRGQAPKAPLRELGEDPVSGNKMVIKDGRFGPYVTDGEINASLRKGDEAETITDERASELLMMRREKLASEPATKKKATKKKATAKKTTAKKSGAKKASAKKSAAKKTTTTRKAAATKAAASKSAGASSDG